MTDRPTQAWPPPVRRNPEATRDPAVMLETDDVNRASARSPSTDSTRVKIVVVGGGFGGMSLAHALQSADIDLTIVDRQNHHLFQPLLYQVATAGLSPADIAAPIRTIVRGRRHTRVLLGEVTGVHANEKQLTLSTGAALPYDYLVLACGARHSYFGHDEWQALAPGIKTIDDATRVRSKLLLAMEFAETSRQEDVAHRDEALNFVIIGGGPTGVEMAGAIAELTRRAAARDFQFITPTCVRIILIEASNRLLSSFPEQLSARAKSDLEALGVEVRLNARVTSIDDAGVSIGDQRIQTMAVIWAAGVQASEAAAWLGAPSDRAGRVLVAPDLSAPGHRDIFVIGDTAAITDRAGRPVPGLATAAKQQGVYVARVIGARVGGRRGPGPFRYRRRPALATIGRQRAVADLGWMRLTGNLAWLFWCTAHLYFLAGFRNRLVVGMNWLWSYLTFNRGARLITGLDHGRLQT
jgi:NADH:ubiquinone reductase (H+-translocating)